ncbi:MAG: 4-hydroxy-3-methylbut-2-enyl diphosphate reductase, partial [Deinococcales bacterium]|nr:4-hydroxy-3-methylbut-2-enyl diphosphate reductase [Chitinophagaceae bacterium]
NYLPNHHAPKILITSGASCPDAVVEAVIEKLLQFYETEISINAVAAQFA